MHVAHNYIEFDNNNTRKNYDMFLSRLGAHPERIRNLFFLYAVTLRAVNRAENFLVSYDYHTQIDPLQD